MRGWSGYDMIVQRVGILRPCFLSMENQVIEDPREKNEVPAPPTHTPTPLVSGGKINVCLAFITYSIN